jgi:hypothetical protein
MNSDDKYQEEESLELNSTEEKGNLRWYIVAALLVLYGVVMTLYSLNLHHGWVKVPWKKTETSALSMLTDSQNGKVSIPQTSHVEVKKDELSEDKPEPSPEETPILNPKVDQVIKQVFPEKDLGLVRKGWKFFTDWFHLRGVASTAVSSMLATVLALGILVFLGYLAFTARTDPLLPPTLVKTLQNHTRLAAAIAAGGLLLSSAVIYFDKGKRLAGFAHVSTMFFALVCIACCFFFTFAELAMRVQTIKLPAVDDGLFAGETASTLLTWATSFLQVNMSVLASGLMLMWISQFIAHWALKKAEGTFFHKACSILSLPLVTVFMAAKKSGGIASVLFSIAIFIISIALTINLVSFDKV